MAKTIECLVSCDDPNARTLPGANGDISYKWLKGLPEELETLIAIVLDGSRSTETLADFDDEECAIRWSFLAEGRDMPKDMPVSVAVIIAEAIWLNALDPDIDNRLFIQAVSGKAGLIRSGYSETADNVVWKALKREAFDRGVDLCLDAWLSGVPFDVVIAG